MNDYYQSPEGVAAAVQNLRDGFVIRFGEVESEVRDGKTHRTLQPMKVEGIQPETGEILRWALNNGKEQWVVDAVRNGHAERAVMIARSLSMAGRGQSTILAMLETHHPEEYATIPTPERTRSDWWKDHVRSTGIETRPGHG